MFIFAAKDFNQSYKRLKYLQQIGAYRERQAQYIEDTEKELHVKITELDNTKKTEKHVIGRPGKRERRHWANSARTGAGCCRSFKAAGRVKTAAERSATKNSQNEPGNKCCHTQGN